MAESRLLNFPLEEDAMAGSNCISCSALGVGGALAAATTLDGIMTAAAISSVSSLLLSLSERAMLVSIAFKPWVSLPSSSLSSSSMRNDSGGDAIGEEGCGGNDCKTLSPVAAVVISTSATVFRRSKL